MGKIAAFYALPHPPIIIPEVGQGEERKIKETSDACDRIAEEIAEIEPDTIIMITSHGPMFRDAVSFSGESTIEGNLGRFRAPQVSFRLDVNLPLTEQIINYAQKEDIPCIKITKNSEISYRLKYELDHGTMVPLYFVNRKFTGYKLVHITYGLLPKLELYRLGMCIKKL